MKRRFVPNRHGQVGKRRGWVKNMPGRSFEMGSNPLKTGADSGNRTPDLLITNQLLYP